MSLGKAQDADNARTYLTTTLGAALDTLDAHTHENGKGNPVKRVQNGMLAARPVAGNAGHLYVAINTNQVFADNGSAWLEAILQSTTQAVTLAGGLTVTAGGLTVT